MGDQDAYIEVKALDNAHLDEDNDNGIVLSDTNSNDSDLKEDDTNNKIESFGLPTFVIIEPLQNGAAMFLLVQLMFWYIPKY